MTIIPPSGCAGPLLLRSCARQRRSESPAGTSRVADRLDALAAWLEALVLADAAPAALASGAHTERARAAGAGGTGARAISLPGEGAGHLQSGPQPHFAPSGDFLAPVSRQCEVPGTENHGVSQADGDSKAP
jgi:hypothetical protein